MRIGFGYDVHRLVSGRPLILGGITIDHPVGLDGHSDADVLLHAISDALFGAAAMGDIGSHFPDTDPAFKGADSVELLRETVRRVREAGFRPVNIDATVSAQAPKLRPHIDAMRARIAEATGLDIGAVSVKATTTERLGFVGTGEGMAAHAVCLVEAAS
ncbi:MAG: 2-C-methyl-D-erythritol 2,4-cyclodiphosphate synthase [Bacteroidetes bacterium]|nr:2-C-methyl-D-erythritol 2,4-cyclodiphosphate synthase [Bacteroidota bacterium]